MRAGREYAIVTASYWAFTLTDGALRMLVLLHLQELGRSPLDIALLFCCYEIFGVVTNAVAGYAGANFGLRATLCGGLLLQVAACVTLAAMAHRLELALLLGTQAMSGVAKDLTKTSAKAWVKLVVRDGDARDLMRWVSLLTGSKNTLKGLGFFLGGLMLALVGFRDASWLMAGLLVPALLGARLGLRRTAGRSATRLGFRALISRDPRINWLSAARFFLFGARDVWFVLALPLFLGESLGWSHPETGAFLALWVIAYGMVQALAPRFTGRGRGSARRPPDAARLARWTPLLLLPLGILLFVVESGRGSALALTIGLGGFGFVFAAASAIHSFLIVHYAEGDRVALNVGFYYMANAAGRLVGTVLSGALFQLRGGGGPGLVACLAASMGLIVASSALARRLAREETRRDPDPVAC